MSAVHRNTFAVFFRAVPSSQIPFPFLFPSSCSCVNNQNRPGKPCCVSKCDNPAGFLRALSWPPDGSLKVWFRQYSEDWEWKQSWRENLPKQEVSFLTGTRSPDLHSKQSFTYTLPFLKASRYFWAHCQETTASCKCIQCRINRTKLLWNKIFILDAGTFRMEACLFFHFGFSTSIFSILI